MLKVKNNNPQVDEVKASENTENNKYMSDNGLFVLNKDKTFYTKGEDSRPMRICMVTTISKTFDCFVADSAKNLASKGFEVTAVCGGISEKFRAKNSEFANISLAVSDFKHSSTFCVAAVRMPPYFLKRFHAR